MKSIPLSDEQREKLIVMCRRFFPEFNHIEFGDKSWKNEIWFDNDGKNQHEINWLELSLFELPKRLYKAALRESERLLSLGAREGRGLAVDIDLPDSTPFESGMDVVFQWDVKGIHPIETLYYVYKKFN